MTKKEALTSPSLLFMFEEILVATERGKPFHDSKDWRHSRWCERFEWVVPLLEDNRIRVINVEPSETFNYHICAATEAGIKWWLSEYTSTVADRRAALVSLLREDPGYYGNNLPGVGIGATLRYDLRWRPVLAKAAMVAIEEGYFELESFYFYARTGEKSFMAKLTEKGLKFFASIPQIQEVF